MLSLYRENIEKSALSGYGKRRGHQRAPLALVFLCVDDVKGSVACAR